MKVLAVLLLSGLAAGGGVGNNDWKMFSRWSTMKAQESCLGEENMKIHTVNLKTAIAKCYQKDAPELNLPPFNSPYRFINTLMTSADSMEHSQLMDLFKMYKMMQTMRGHDSSSYMPSMFNDQHYGAKPYSMDNTNKSWMEKMMMKIAMKKMFEKTMMNNYDSNMNNNQYKDMFDFDSSDMYESQSNFEKMMDAYGSKMNEDKMMENMMMYKMQQMQRSNDESSYNPLNKNTYRERMAALLQRNKRQASGSKNGNANAAAGARRTPAASRKGSSGTRKQAAATNRKNPGTKTRANSDVVLPQNIGLGDRLAEKLREVQDEMEEEIGNMTCVMREIGVLNEQNELDFAAQKRAFEKFNIPDQWLKNRLLNDMELCNRVAKSLPSETRRENSYSGLMNKSEVESYMDCCKYSKMRTCMYKDVKETLEKNYGSLDKIMEQTQLNEDQLFPLVTQLLHGEEMDYYGF